MLTLLFVLTVCIFKYGAGNDVVKLPVGWLCWAPKMGGLATSVSAAHPSSPPLNKLISVVSDNNNSLFMMQLKWIINTILSAHTRNGKNAISTPIDNCNFSPVHGILNYNFAVCTNIYKLNPLCSILHLLIFLLISRLKYYASSKFLRIMTTFWLRTFQNNVSQIFQFGDFGNSQYMGFMGWTSSSV